MLIKDINLNSSSYGLVVAVHFSLIITNVETVSGLFFNLSIQHIIKLRITCFVST